MCIVGEAARRARRTCPSARTRGGILQPVMTTRLAAWGTIVAVGVALGCGSGEDLAGGGGSTGCEAPAVTLPDGSCLRPGIAPDGCSPGFVHDGAFGCQPVLPATPCPDGLMALPGDEACRPLMSCGQGRWGDIPVQSDTLHVDAAYTGGDADGSATRPFASIGEAVAVAADGALVAVAAGYYPESIIIQDKALRLWGRCPDQVEVEGNDGLPTLYVGNMAHGTEIRGLALRGPDAGVVVVGAEQVVLEQLWVHHNAARGLSLEATAEAAPEVTVAGSLIEHNDVLGVYISGAVVTIDGTAIRNSQPHPSHQEGGRGLNIRRACPDGICDPTARASVTVRGSLLELNHELGIFVVGSDLTLEGSVVRDTLPQASDLRFGRGLSVQVACDGGNFCDPMTRSTATIAGSLFERNRYSSIFVAGSDFEVLSTVVRDTLPQAADGHGGRGIDCQAGNGPDSAAPLIPSGGAIRRSLIERSGAFGVMLASLSASVEDTVVRGTVPSDAGDVFGDGIAMVDRGSPTHVVVSRCLVGDSARAGVASFGAAVSLDTTAVTCAAFPLNGEPFEGRDFSFTDEGQNGCGCPAPDGECKILSDGLEPPDAL